MKVFNLKFLFKKISLLINGKEKTKHSAFCLSQTASIGFSRGTFEKYLKHDRIKMKVIFIMQSQKQRI